MTIDGYTLRTATADDFTEVQEVLSDAFTEDFEADVAEMERGVFEPERTLLAMTEAEKPRIAGLVAAFTRDLSVPGGVLPAAHVTMVGVSSLHRRRGLLTAMMHRQLADVRALGEPIAVLWASEGRIYQRFGYGLAATRLVIESDHEVVLNVPRGTDEGQLRAVPLAEAANVLPPIYAQVHADRPGHSSRDSRWWEYVLADPPSRRGGAGSRKVVVHEGPSGADGYALWRIKSDWDPVGARGAVWVREVVAANPGAYRALLRYLFDIDLTRSVRIQFAAPDEPLLYLVNEPRRLAGRLADALWVRVVDVPAALAGRRYLTPIELTIEVQDALVPENAATWLLTGGPDGARCTRTDRPAELRMDVGALGAAYLGGAALTTLAAGGRVTELVPGSVQRASLAFGWHRPPAATEVF